MIHCCHVWPIRDILPANQTSGSEVAIASGSSRDIGKGCALHLARAGFDVVVCATRSGVTGVRCEPTPVWIDPSKEGGVKVPVERRTPLIVDLEVLGEAPLKGGSLKVGIGKTLDNPENQFTVFCDEPLLAGGADLAAYPVYYFLMGTGF